MHIKKLWGSRGCFMCHGSSSFDGNHNDNDEREIPETKKKGIIIEVWVNVVWGQ